MKNPISSYDELLMNSRLGDENATYHLRGAVFARRNAYVNAALIDVPYAFSEAERDFVFQASFEETCKDFSFQSRCKFLSYFILKMHYAFCNLAKTKMEFATSILKGSEKESTFLLRDCSQQDYNDLMGTLFTWREDINALAMDSGKFSRRDLSIANKRIDGIRYATIAEEEDCSISTCKKVWNRFLKFCKVLLGINDSGYKASKGSNVSGLE